MNIEQILIIAFTAFLSFVSGRAQNIASRHDVEAARKEEQFNHIIERQKELSSLQSEMRVQLHELDKKLNTISKCTGRLKDGGLIILRDRIIQSCRIFIKRGAITITARNNIRDMYRCYHDEFGGNGDGEYYYKQMMQLPVDTDVPLVSHFECGGKHEDDKM